jgi:hypothetical protein
MNEREREQSYTVGPDGQVRNVGVVRPQLIRAAFEETMKNVSAFRPEVWEQMTPEMEHGYWMIFSNGALAAYQILQRSKGPDEFVGALAAIRDELNAIHREVQEKFADRYVDRVVEESAGE